MPDDPSSSRQQLARLRDELCQLVASLLERAPLWRGTLYRLDRLCGHPTCRCAQGHLHSTMVLSDRTGDRQQTLVPNAADLLRLRSMTAQYRQFRQARARLGKLFRAMLPHIDRLEQAGLDLAQQQLPRARLLSDKQQAHARAKRKASRRGKE